MEIILKEDVIGLGYKHDIVNVKSGYGRNYLIPSGKGVIASESAKKALAEELKQKAKKLEKIKNDAQSVADKLAGVALTIAAKVSAQGTIYGSVNAVMIADELQKLGFDIDRKLITIKDVKTVGEHKATVRLHKEVSVEIPVTVVPDAPIEAPVVEEKPVEAPVDEAQAQELADEQEVLEAMDAPAEA
jgi:large subunit ribosomal protein L9